MRTTTLKKFDLQTYIPKIVLLPSILMIAVFVYGFIIFTIYLSFTSSKILPVFDWTGGENYQKLFNLETWYIALKNLGLFSLFYITISIGLGLLLAIFINQKILGENTFRAVYLYPMAISFIVTGTAWKWILDPGIGFERVMRNIGFSSFTFDWIKSNEMAIYCVIIAGIWQVTGFIMAIFLAGLRGINDDLIEAAAMDGANKVTLYTKIIIPQLAPSFLSSFVILAHLVIKSYDLIIALTNGGPGRATEMPSTFIYSYYFTRNQMSIGASAAVIMLFVIAIIVIPYLRREVKGV